MHKSGQALSLLAIVFFGFVSLSLPYPILSPLFLHPESSLIQAVDMSQSWRILMLGLTLAAYPFAQFFGSPILGSLSDSFGRKKLLVLTMIGTGLGYLLSGFAIANNQVILLILSRVLTGFFEGNMGIAQASISDLKIDKHDGLGAILAMSSLGYLVGPLIGGFLCDKHLVNWFSYSVPFYFGTVMALLLGLLVALCYQETIQPGIKKRSLMSEFDILKKIKNVYQKETLRKAFIIILLMSLSIDCYYEFYPAFLVEKWGMTPKSIGLYSATLSLALSIGAFWLPRWIKSKGNPETFRSFLAMMFAISLLSLLFAFGPLTLNMHFFAVGLVYAALNTIQSVIISDEAGSHEQGEVMGLQWGLRMLGDSFLCIIGSFLLVQKASFPIILAIVFALITMWYIFVQKRQPLEASPL